MILSGLYEATFDRKIIISVQEVENETRVEQSIEGRPPTR
jgi:hypothetical protein